VPLLIEAASVREVARVRWDDVYVSSSAVALGRPEPVDDAVAAGRYELAIRKAHDYQAISVAGDRDAADMAVDAARTAIARAGAAEVGVFLHAYVDHQGRQEPASYIQGMAYEGRARAVGVEQGCNGTIASLELGCLYLTAGSGAVVVTSADKYAGEGDRYGDDPGGVPADGATAMVLTRGDGVARVLATEIVGDGRFSGQGALDPAEFADRKAYRTEQRRRLETMMRVMGEAKRDCVAAALETAAVKADEVGHWLLPYNGRFMVDRDFYAEFGIDDERTTWQRGRTVGHLTGGDSVVGLTHLLETGAAAAGDRVVMFGDSAGFAFGCAVLEIVRRPAWADR
jgi:3-oxoacyl-[acyl-carrier-protein] synthase III